MRDRSAFPSLLIAGAASLALAVPAASAAQAGATPVPARPPVHHHHRIVRHPIVVPRHPLRHAIHPLAPHHRHPAILHGAPHPIVRHAPVARRHAALCQQVLVHQHWVQRCR
jgi:hypothetical protein